MGMPIYIVKEKDQRDRDELVTCVATGVPN